MSPNKPTAATDHHFALLWLLILVLLLAFAMTFMSLCFVAVPQDEVDILTAAKAAPTAATPTPNKKTKKAKKKVKGVNEGTKAMEEEQGGDNNLVTISQVMT